MAGWSRYTGPMKFPVIAAALLALAQPAHAQDPATLARIRDEGMNRSHALELFDHLTTVIGPRLTASPAFKQSVDWAVKKLRDDGLSNAHVESWPFGRGWTLEGQVAELTSPRYMPLIAYAEAWSPSTNGIVEGKPVYIGDLANADSVRAHAASIRGAIVLATKPQDVFITKDRLQPTEHDQPVPIGQPRPNNASGPLTRQTMFATLRELGAAAVLRPTEGNEGTMFVLGSRNSSPDNSVASLIVSSEQYNLLVRSVRDAVPVKLRVGIRSTYYTADTNAYNVIAEIPGTDPKIG